MKTIEIIILKITGLGTTILYGWSFLWITLLYLYGWLYYPLRELGLKKSLYFEIFVVVLSLCIFGLIFLKFKGRTFWKLLLQDIVLIVTSVPFLGLIFGIFDNGFDEPESLWYVYTSMFLLTILTININHWIKTN